MSADKNAGSEVAQPKGRIPRIAWLIIGVLGLSTVGLLVGVIVLATATASDVADCLGSSLDMAADLTDSIMGGATTDDHSGHGHSDSSSGSTTSVSSAPLFASTKGPSVTNPCAGTKPAAGAGFDNEDCSLINATDMFKPQAGADVTADYVGGLNASGIVPITVPYFEQGLCPVNVHWHLGAEHRSEGQYDETGSGPAGDGAHRRAGDVRLGLQCKHYTASDSKFTTEYDWQHCVGMHVGETYEVHWPHSRGGACGTVHQYQTPFYDGVFCYFGRGKVQPTTQEAIGVQAQVFTIVNDEDYYYPDLFRGMIVDSTHGKEMTYYTGSTTGTSRDNEMCSWYAPITWQVDRTCHMVSASAFDKMCADMKAQNDDMSDDLHAHGAREVVLTEFVADNQVDLVELMGTDPFHGSR